MSTQTAQDNSALFVGRSEPRFKEEAKSSPWTTAPRVNFTAYMEREHGAQMRRSRAGQSAKVGMIVGHLK